MTDWLEVRIPISPREDYFNRVHLIARSIRSLGGRYAGVRVRATVGGDCEPEDLDARMPWSRSAGIDWRWVERGEFLQWKQTQHEYIATMMERFRPPFSTKYVLMLDADVLVMRRFDELIALLDSAHGVAAVMAHVSPFQFAEGAQHAAWWGRMSVAAGVGLPDFGYEHSGWGLMDQDEMRRFAPPYFNTGVILATAAELERLYEPYTFCLSAVRNVLDTYFFEQIALTLGLVKAGIAAHVLPLRYNYPNQRQFDEAHPDELAEVRFLHFLRTNVIDRQSDFGSLQAISEFLARSDLGGSNEALRRRVGELLPLVLAERTTGQTGVGAP